MWVFPRNVVIFKSSWGLEWEKKEKALVFSGFGFDVYHLGMVQHKDFWFEIFTYWLETYTYNLMVRILSFLKCFDYWVWICPPSSVWSFVKSFKPLSRIHINLYDILMHNFLQVHPEWVSRYVPLDYMDLTDETAGVNVKLELRRALYNRNS